MPKKEAPLEYLQKFIPAASASKVLEYLRQHKVHLTITQQRKTVLGDYRHLTHDRTHRISVNGNLNRYSFLITLIHELAHLGTFIHFGKNVQPHGKEWKKLYALMLTDFLALPVFPGDIIEALKKSLNNLPATSCADDELMRILKKYNNQQSGLVMVEQLHEGKLFEINPGRVFKKGKKLRKRYQCTEVSTGKIYLFSPIYEVYAV